MMTHATLENGLCSCDSVSNRLELKVVTLTRRATIDSECGAVNSELNGAIGRDVECPFTGEVSLRVAIRPIRSLETSCGFHEHLVTVDQAGFSVIFQEISIPALADVGSFSVYACIHGW